MLSEHWRDLPYLTIQATAALFGCSRAAIYMHLRSGTLTAVRVCGRTLVRSGDVARMLDEAEPWQPNLTRLAAAMAAQARPRWSDRNNIPAAHGKRPGARAAADKEQRPPTPKRESRSPRKVA